jgi:hypothetical protein
MPVTHCSSCHRLLTDPYSIALGMGPECRGKLRHGTFPKAKWKVSHGHVIFDGLEGQTEPINISKAENDKKNRNGGAMSSTGMLWSINRIAILEHEIRAAAIYYRQKYGAVPDLCRVNPLALATQPLEQVILPPDGQIIQVRPARYITPGCLWMGTEAK